MALSGAFITTKTAGSAGTTIPTSSNSLIEGAVSSILGYNETSIKDTADATAATTSAAGYTAEGEAYGTAEQIAQQNAVVAGIAGNIRALQSARATGVTIGEQKAQVAAAGFKASGSNLDLLRSSLQQGYLDQQLIGIQTELTKGGYLEEAAASTAEQKATQVTADAATAAAKALTDASASAKASAAAETAALNDFIGSSTLTKDQQLILKPLNTVTTAGSVMSTGSVTSTGSTTSTGGLTFNGKSWVDSGSAPAGSSTKYGFGIGVSSSNYVLR